NWSAVGSGIDNVSYGIFALAVYDDGAGPALYAGGSFQATPTQPFTALARWNGKEWKGVGPPLNPTALGWLPMVYALTVFDDGSGAESLYIGGQFGGAGDVEARNLIRWDGSEFSSIGHADGEFDGEDEHHI